MKNILINTLLIFMLASMGYIGFILFYPFTPLIINKRPAKVITQEVKVGGTLIYQVDYCRYEAKTARVYRTILGDINIPTPVVNSVTKLGCHIAHIPLVIPIGTPKGNYTVGVNIEFTLNILRTVTVSFTTEPFKVI